MWTARSENLAGYRGQRHFVEFNGRSVSYEEVLKNWRDDEAFRTWFNDLLASSPYREFRWETPTLTAATLTRSFECVLLDSPGLARRTEPEAFEEHFRRDQGLVISFPNLGRNAILVVPAPLADDLPYGHLADFVRYAPDGQRDELWQVVSSAMLARVNDIPVWLSTAGAGVSWLHVRLDDTPKYYGYDPYRATG